MQLDWMIFENLFWQNCPVLSYPTHHNVASKIKKSYKLIGYSPATYTLCPFPKRLIRYIVLWESLLTQEFSDYCLLACSTWNSIPNTCTFILSHFWSVPWFCYLSFCAYAVWSIQWGIFQRSFILEFLVKFYFNIFLRHTNILGNLQ